MLSNYIQRRVKEVVNGLSFKNYEKKAKTDFNYRIKRAPQFIIHDNGNQTVYKIILSQDAKQVQIMSSNGWYNHEEGYLKLSELRPTKSTTTKTKTTKTTKTTHKTTRKTTTKATTRATKK